MYAIINTFQLQAGANSTHFSHANRYIDNWLTQQPGFSRRLLCQQPWAEVWTDISFWHCAQTAKAAEIAMHAEQPYRVLAHHIVAVSLRTSCQEITHSYEREPLVLNDAMA